MWLPKRMYELYPYATLIVALLAETYRHNFLMLLSGLALIATSGMVLKLRHNYRIAKREDRERELARDIAREQHAQRKRIRSEDV